MAAASEIQAKFTADISDIQGKLSTLTGELNNVGSSIENTAKGFALGGVALEALNKAFEVASGFIESGFQEYTKVNEAMGQFNALASSTKSGLQSYSEVLDNQVNNALANTTYSHLQVIDAMTQFAKYGIDASKAAEMMQVAEDASAGSGVALDNVVQTLQMSAQGLAGRGLKQLGVSMEEVRTSSDKLGDTLKQLSKYHGDAAVMAQTLSGQETQLNNNLDEVKTQIVSQLVPAFNSALSSALGFTKGLADNGNAQIEIQRITYQVIEIFKALFDSIMVVVNGLETFIDALLAIPEVAVSVAMDIIQNWQKLEDSIKVIANNILQEIKSAFTGAKPDIEAMPDIAMNNTTKAFNVIGKIVGDSAKNTSNSFKNLGNDLAGAFTGAGFKVTDLGGKMGALPANSIPPIEAVATSTKNLTDEMTKFGLSIDDAVQKHQDAMQKIEDGIATASKDYAQANLTDQSNYEDTVAKEIKAKQDEMAKLKTEIAQASAYGQTMNEADLADKQNQLAQDQAFLDKHAADAQGAQSQINELNKDSIDQAKDALAKKQADEKTAYDKKLSDLNTQLKTENDSYDASLAKMATDFTGNWENILNYIKTSATPKIIDAFDEMVKQANVKLSGIGIKGLGLPEISASIPGKNQHAVGGMITETGIHLLHAGEQVIPRSQVESGKGSGNNINVNFYGAMNISKEADENRLADKIRNVMMNDLQLSQHGLY